MQSWRLASPKSAVCAVGMQTQGRADVGPSSVLAHSSLLGGQSVVLFRPSTDFIRSTHIMEGNVLYSESTNLNVNLIQKHPHTHIQNV